MEFRFDIRKIKYLTSGQENDIWTIIIGNNIYSTDTAKYKICIRRKTEVLNVERSLKITVCTVGGLGQITVKFKLNVKLNPLLLRIQLSRIMYHKGIFK